MFIVCLYAECTWIHGVDSAAVVQAYPGGENHDELTVCT
jgi:hypothetical protein